MRIAVDYGAPFGSGYPDSPHTAPVYELFQDSVLRRLAEYRVPVNAGRQALTIDSAGYTFGSQSLLRGPPIAGTHELPKAFLREIFDNSPDLITCGEFWY
jgi:hypothetical protein